jgi:hypothetical protein
MPLLCAAKELQPLCTHHGMPAGIHREASQAEQAAEQLARKPDWVGAEGNSSGKAAGSSALPPLKGVPPIPHRLSAGFNREWWMAPHVWTDTAEHHSSWPSRPSTCVAT